MNKCYYEICYNDYGGNDIYICRFVTAVTDEWVAKDICRRHGSLKYEKREVVATEEKE